jgi:hypothetical protein
LARKQSQQEGGKMLALSLRATLTTGQRAVVNRT